MVIEIFLLLAFLWSNKFKRCTSKHAPSFDTSFSQAYLSQTIRLSTHGPNRERSVWRVDICFSSWESFSGNISMLGMGFLCNLADDIRRNCCQLWYMLSLILPRRILVMGRSPVRAHSAVAASRSALHETFRSATSVRVLWSNHTDGTCAASWRWDGDRENPFPEAPKDKGKSALNVH